MIKDDPVLEVLRRQIPARERPLKDIEEGNTARRLGGSR